MKKQLLVAIYEELNVGGYIKEDGKNHYMVYNNKGQECIPLNAEEFQYLIDNNLIK